MQRAMSITGRLIVTARHGLSLNGAQRACARAYSSSGDIDPIKKSVFISQSTDVFTNLALENWLYCNFDFSKHHVLLLWRNDPCVVIGRHQNPWLECNVPMAEKQNIALARRNTGGGTVYHDNGNLNLTFFMPRERYNRRYNLNIITNALFRNWGLTSEINKREDIVINGDYKISGTAARLGRLTAYHHCTLLVDVNKSYLSSVLERKENDIITNATTSVRSSVKNLCDINRSIRMNNLVSAIGWEYLRTKALVLEDGKYDLVEQQKGFQFVNPTEGWFPGINEFIQKFHSWDWNYGRTPKFTVIRTLDVATQDGETHRLNLSLEVKDGIVQEIRMSLPAGLASTNFGQDASVISNLRGTKYDLEMMENIIAAIGGKTVMSHTTQSDEAIRDTATLQ